MMFTRKKKLQYGLGLVIIFLSLFGVVLPVSAQTQTPTPSSAPSPTTTQNNSKSAEELQNRIAELQKKVNDLQSEGKTLSSQISVMDNQIKLTQYRIDATKEEINQLSKDIDTTSGKIDSLDGALDKISKTLISRVSASYQLGAVQPISLLLTANSFSDFISRVNYVRIVQANDRKLMYNTVQARNDYENQKEIFEGKKEKVLSLQTQLEEYTTQLDQDKQSKQQLLSVTKNDEARYQKLLQEARAQISSFKSFANSRVGSGASILPAQASPDGWFYSQRDERWGRNNIGSSPEQVWEVGCLLTAAAMVMKQRGENVTPADIAGNSSNFFSNTAYMLIPWVGGRFQSVWGGYGDVGGAIDSRLANGEPVIVGVKAGPFGTHFIVLKSGSGGNYIMNDPWSGANLNFSDYYSTSQIFQYGYLK